MSRAANAASIACEESTLELREKCASLACKESSYQVNALVKVGDNFREEKPKVRKAEKPRGGVR
eukprot:1486316-Pleurochrysis_carterae.AAC.2